MKKIEINITKAKLKDFTVILDEKEPTVSATIGLYTEGGNEITSYNINTHHWEDSKRFDLPVSVIAPITDIARLLEKVVVQHCRDSQKLIEGTTTPDNTPERPIDLSDIPF